MEGGLSNPEVAGEAGLRVFCEHQVLVEKRQVVFRGPLQFPDVRLLQGEQVLKLIYALGKRT